MDFVLDLKKKAKKIDANIVLPEANMDERVYKACKYILKHRLSRITVFGKRSQFDEDFDSDLCTMIDISRTKKVESFSSQLFALRKGKISTLEEARALVKQANYFACMLVYNGLADGVVLGAKYTTKDAIKPALQIIKTKGENNASGLMILHRADHSPIVCSDVSLQISPDEKELADIAFDAGEFMDKTLGITPRIAMLSYSTKGSGKGPSVDMVRNATQELNARTDYILDGEVQADAALDGRVGALKGVSKQVSGKANVLIFPDINAGNIGYKLLTTLGGFSAIGPIMVGLNKPVNDLSRGCNVKEIINTVLITKLQTK